MKAQELRIGNTYHRKHGKGWTYTTITPEIMGKIFTDSKEYALNDFEPIPLTLDVLERAGFKKDNNGVEIAHEDYFEWWQKDFPVIETICTSENGDYLFDENTDTLRIHYLHQLQNLYYSLTGHELTITF